MAKAEKPTSRQETDLVLAMSENITPHSQEQKCLLLQNWTQEVFFVNVIIDTQYIIDNYPPNQSKDNPPMIFPNRKGFNPIYMVTSGENNINSGTDNLQVNAYVGDQICWASQSETSNFDHSVYIYAIKPVQGKVFSQNDVRYSCYNKTIVVPSKNDPTLMVEEKRTFPFMTAPIEDTGTESYHIWFAIYKREGTTQKLYGYFREDPTIVVNG